MVSMDGTDSTFGEAPIVVFLRAFEIHCVLDDSGAVHGDKTSTTELSPWTARTALTALFKALLFDYL
jgi:hypothetical protein